MKFLAVRGEGRNVSEEEECEDVDDDDDPSSTEAGNKRMEKNCDDVYVVRAEEDGVDIDRPQWYVRNFYHYCDAIVDCFDAKLACCSVCVGAPCASQGMQIFGVSSWFRS